MKLSEKIRNFVKENLVLYQPFILFSVIIIGLLFFISRLPYFNLFFNLNWILITYWICTVYIFRYSPRVSFVISIFCLFAALLFSILNNEIIAEQFGDLTFFFMAVGVLQMIWGNISKLRENHD